MKLPKGTRLAIRQALEKTHSAPERKRILARTQRLYNAFIREAPAPGGMNLLRSQYYGGLSVFAFYEAMDRNVEPDVLQEILWRMLLGGGDIRKRTPIRFHLVCAWLIASRKFSVCDGQSQTLCKSLLSSEDIVLKINRLHCRFFC